MAGTLDTVLRFTALVVGGVLGAGAHAPLPVLLGVASVAALVAVALLVRADAAGHSAPPLAPAHPSAAGIALPVVVAQSHPDADGHVRARAPGRLRPTPRRR